VGNGDRLNEEQDVIADQANEVAEPHVIPSPARALKQLKSPAWNNFKMIESGRIAENSFGEDSVKSFV